MRSLLEVENLTVSLPVEGAYRRVLTDVSFELAAGRTLGLVGESGSGKSMTVRAINRLLPPGAHTSGRIGFDGGDVLDLRAEALRRYRADDVAMIFQDARAAINPVRRIGDFLTEALVLTKGASRAAARDTAAGLLAAVGIPDAERRMRQYPHELSGGLLQRVMIAAAVAGRPRLVLADEPTTALDVTTQAEVIGILRRMQQEHRMAVLFITHDLELAAAICDETIVLYAGEVMERTASASLHTQPLHPYTAALVGARPDVTAKKDRLLAVPGHPTSAYEAPSGCSFAPRCRFAAAACTNEHPPLRPRGDGLSRCLRIAEIAPDLAGPGAAHEREAEQR
ncbi:ABC transporter ATP-binding protein [Streptomyces endophyticus]|uniref:ABC transporter ATP-binding protein n=1 Tax=Streptomyces endophyticus TaxID=714166 RepID=A0ABU6F9P8_9ACTN|nr:ABC transporter ATP-binding protein [Streptomyces endophyticus]MEB8340762.1 ABC transporter ATP-binding protein [Streptomyces endophyticus]